MKESLWFAVAAAALVAAVLLVMVLPVIRSRRAAPEEDPRGEAREALAREKASLDERLARGEIGHEAYDRLLADIERRALEELRPRTAPRLRTSRRAALATAAFLLLAVPLFAWVLYRQWGEGAILEMDKSRAFAPTASQQAAVAAASDPAAEMKAQAENRAKAGISEQTSDQDLESWCRRHPEDGRAAVMYARRLADRREFARATEFYLSAVGGDAKARNPVVFTEAAAALISIEEKASFAGRLRKAAGLLDEALAMQPGYGPALKVRAAVAVEQGEWGVAESVLRTMASKFPEGSAERAQLEKDASRAAALKGGSPKK